MFSIFRYIRKYHDIFQPVCWEWYASGNAIVVLSFTFIVDGTIIDVRWCMRICANGSICRVATGLNNAPSSIMHSVVVQTRPIRHIVDHLLHLNSFRRSAESGVTATLQPRCSSLPETVRGAHRAPYQHNLLTFMQFVDKIILCMSLSTLRKLKLRRTISHTTFIGVSIPTSTLEKPFWEAEISVPK